MTTRFDRHRCMDGVEVGPEAAARRLVMAALLYYEFSTNVMTDHEYDALGVFVRDHFEHIGETMQFCIGRDWVGTEEDRLFWTASGAGFKITRRAFYGALSWAEHLGVPVYNEREWKLVDMDLMTGIEYDTIRG